MKKTIALSAIVLTLGCLGSGLWAQQTHQHGEEPSAASRDRNRWQWQLPNLVLREIGVKPGMTVADVGAGDGYFTFLMADVVGPNGRVYANDIDDRGLQAIRDRSREDGIKNITVVMGTQDDVLLPEKQMDIVLMVNVIHQVKNPAAFFKTVARSLKPGAMVAIVQWDAAKMDSETPEDWGPDRDNYTLRTNLRTIYDAGFEVVEILDFLPVQRIFLCQPAPGRVP